MSDYTINALMGVLLLGSFGYLIGPKQPRLGVFGVVSLLLFWLYCALFVFSPFYLDLPYFETDFIDYCIAIERYSDLDAYFPSKRSRFAALLPGMLADSYGVINALAISSWIGTLCIGCGIYLWARQLGGKCAGWHALALSLAMSPIVSMGRYLGFYPLIIGLFTISAAFFVMAWKRSNKRTILLSSICSSLCFLIDARGAVWGAVFGVSLLLCIVKKHRFRPLYYAVFLVPFVLSWWAGSYNWGLDVQSLTQQLDPRPLFGDQHTESLPRGFVWGKHLNLIEIMRSVPIIWGSDGPPKMIGQRPSFWWSVGLLCLFGLLLKKRRVNLMPLVISVSPFLLSLYGASWLVESHLRFEAHGLPAVAVMGGLWVSFLSKGSRFTWPSIRMASVLPLLLSVFIWGLLLWGYVSSPFSPRASWRHSEQVQRTILFKTLSQAFPHKDWSDSGIEMHEIPPHIDAWGDSVNWPSLCAKQLQKDNVTHPFYVN